MWNDFDGKPYSREEFLTLLDDIPSERLHWCKFLTVHNTAAPSLKQWCGPAAKPAQRIVNLQRYYEKDRGWRAGPHAFIPPDPTIACYGFTRFDVPGIHASCFNKHSIGLEMVGDFDSEEFTSGNGAIVRDNAVFVLAALHNKMGLRPDGYELGKSGLHFHIDCKRDNHTCPGKKVDRAALVRDVLAEMARLTGEAPAVANGHDPSLVVAVAATVTSPVAPTRAVSAPVATVTATVPAAPKPRRDLDYLNEIAEKSSRLATHAKNAWLAIKLAFGIGAGGATAVATANQMGLIDPNKGNAAVATSWGAQHPWLMLLIGATLVLVVFFGILAIFFPKIIKGIVSAYKEGRYQPRGDTSAKEA